MRLIARRKWNTAHRVSQSDAELLDRLRSRDDTPRIDPVFADRLRAQLGAPLSGAVPGAHGPRASSTPVGRPRARWSRPDRSRRPWYAGLLAAAMICLIVAGGLVVNAERSRRQSDQPAMFAAPTTNPATATLTPASPTPAIQPTRRVTRVPTSSPRAKSTAAPANVATDGQSVGGGGDGGGQSGAGAHGDVGNGGKTGAGASSGHGQGGSESKGHANQSDGSDGSDQATGPESSTEDLGNSQNTGGSGEAHGGGNQSDQPGNESAPGKSPPGKP